MTIYFKRADCLQLLPAKRAEVKLRQLLLCKREGCDNEARYSSNYCGVCDLLYNEAKGERL